MKRSLLIVLMILSLLPATYATTFAQDYVPAPVTISKDKVKNGGKVYYSHIVIEKQTLFSIAKAYGVTIPEIYAANPGLEEKGLQKNAIILIPDKDSKTYKKPKATTQEDTEEENADESTQMVHSTTAGNSTIHKLPEENTQKHNSDGSLSKQDYNVYTVKWFENLDDIADKFGVPVDVIMKFNGMQTKSVSRKQKIKIPINPNLITALDTSSREVEKVVVPETQSATEKVENEISDAADKFRFHGKSIVNVSLLLPFNAKADVSGNNMDFYCGSLLAIRDLSNKGIGTDLSVFDVANGAMPVTAERFSESDVVIGPVSAADLGRTLAICPASTEVVSPLDHKAYSLAAGHSNFIQAPASYEEQYKDLINWIKEDHRAGDRVVLVSEKGVSSPVSTDLHNDLSASGINYTTLSYAILEGKNVLSSFSGMMNPTSINRILIASESEAFVNDVIRNLNLMLYKGYPVVLYAPSKIRSFETIEVESLHKLNLHISTSYYIDYDNEDVKSFVLSYRSLFNSDPGPFAFQGYDTAYYFIQACSRNGKNWKEDLTDKRVSCLQADFRFRKLTNGGYVNTAVRRIVYRPDYSIRLVK